VSRPVALRWNGRLLEADLALRLPHASIELEGRHLEATIHRDGDWIEARIGERAVRCAAVAGSRGVWVAHEGRTYFLDRVHREAAGRSDLDTDEVRAPMTGRVVAVAARPGAAAREGDLLVTIEAMKMEFRLTAPEAGRVIEVTCSEGDRVELGQLLVKLAPGNAETAP
jgi:acetyl/propionyl-CoA carboxylase alpha subunit